MLAHITPRPPRRSGTAAVEFAIVLPLLATMMLGIWEVGRLVQVTQILSNAAREGARRASTASKSAAEVDAVVKSYLTNSGIKTTGCKVQIYNLTKNPYPDPQAPPADPTAAAQMDHLRVTITVPINNVRWVVIDQFTTKTTLASSADWLSMRDQALVIDVTMPVN